MTSIIENIKQFFAKKEKGENVGPAPKGVCPVCWGHSEWEGQYYEIKKDQHAKPGDATYDSFISKIANNHVSKTHNLKNQYICTTCNKEIPS